MELKAQKREHFGRAVKQLRKQNLVPGELYGHGTENQHVSVTQKDFAHVLSEAGESTVIDLKIDKETHPVLIKDIHRHPITDEFLNVDFYRVKMDEKITTSVELEFIGQSPAVNDLAGVLVKAVNEIEVEAFPADLPSSIEIDLGKLKEIGDGIQIKDLDISEKVSILADPETTLATVTAQMTEEADQAMAADADLSSIQAEADSEEETEGDKPDAESSEETKPSE